MIKLFSVFLISFSIFANTDFLIEDEGIYFGQDQNGEECWVEVIEIDDPWISLFKIRSYVISSSLFEEEDMIYDIECSNRVDVTTCSTGIMDDGTFYRLDVIERAYGDNLPKLVHGESEQEGYLNACYDLVHEGE